MINKIAKDMFHPFGEEPKDRAICLIMYGSKPSLSDCIVGAYNKLTRQFITRSYPHPTGEFVEVHGENTVKVERYTNKRDYIPLSDIDGWIEISED